MLHTCAIAALITTAATTCSAVEISCSFVSVPGNKALCGNTEVSSLLWVDQSILIHNSYADSIYT